MGTIAKWIAATLANLSERFRIRAYQKAVVSSLRATMGLAFSKQRSIIIRA